MYLLSLHYLLCYGRAYSILGTGIYDIVLIIFGMKALTTHNAIITLTSIGVFAIALYAIYRFAISRMTRRK